MIVFEKHLQPTAVPPLLQLLVACVDEPVEDVSGVFDVSSILS